MRERKTEKRMIIRQDAAYTHRKIIYTIKIKHTQLTHQYHVIEQLSLDPIKPYTDQIRICIVKNWLNAFR